MTEPNIFQILANDLDFGEVIFFIILALFSIVGSVVSKLKKKEAENKAKQLRQQQAQRNNKANDDGWQIIAPPKKLKKPSPQPVRFDQTKSKKPSIQDFVRNKVEESHEILTHHKEVEHLKHVKAEPLPVLHADGELSPRHSCADDDQDMPILNPAEPVAPKRKPKKRDVAPSPVTPMAVEAPPQLPATLTLASLKNPSAARAAMVFHEILSPPKALREEDVMWD